MVMDNESNQERQENELEVLKAIYGDHLQEIEIPIKEWQPLNVVLHLEPQQTSLQQQAHTFVDLHIVCSDKYPYEMPVMKIEKSKGLSTLQIETLHNELRSHAESLKGEVMVFELASFVQALLLQYNKPSFKSLYDEMFNRKVKKQEEEEEKKKVLEELTRKEILMEIKTKKEALKQELRCKSSDDPNEEVYQISTRPDIPQHVKLKKHLPISNLSDIEDVNERTQSNIKLEELANFWSISSKKMPRLENEFETLQYLGKGAFGEVLKVRNKLDQCMYAIKVIRLNPGNKPLYRKITREVKLLSRLNHENVVRYYNSWIETCHEITSTRKLQGEVDQTISKTVDNSPVSLTIDDWDMNHVANDDSSEDQSDDTFGISFQSQSGDAPKNYFHEENSKQDENSTVEKENENNEITHNFMYIQMEFCEKSTLRTAIDKGLYEDEKRVWRLLREIIEGLCHIHQQGIIHRDLKPVNVFIDSEDHVKIGDFGLATTNIRHKAGILMDQGPGEPLGPSLTDTSQTGQVGTALYVAPELSSYYLKTAYNQKVDIYSLGIMFFEMCHPPLQTHMERIKVLTNLRLENCVFPADFIDNTRMHKTKLIRDMLIHDPILRPSSADLLQSELLPPPQFEEYEVQELLRHTLKNPQSKLYKHLISLCFNQKISTAQNVTYDMSLSKGRYFMVLLEEVTTRIRKVFHNHGAFSISSPLLLPSGTFDMSNLAVSVMTKWGGVVMLPYDLRLPFARFLAHNPFITQLKRYSIERVYRERRVLGHHPRELYECAFDIVTPNLGNMVAESELLSFVWEVLNQFPVLLENNCLIRLNHTSLIQAIFLHCDIDKSKYTQISRILSQSKEDNFTKAQLESALIAIDLTEHTVCSLLNLLDLENSFGRMFTTLQSIFKRSTSTMILFKQAFHQIEMIINNVSELGVKCPITISLGLLENISYYSGMICQFVWEQRNKQGHNQHHVFASGGRYDNLIAELRRVHGGQYHSNDVVQTAVGITVSLDKLVSTLQTQQFKVSPIDVVICSLGTKLITREKLNLARDLWAAGVKTYIFDSLQNLEEIQNICLEMTIFHIVILKDTDPGYVRLRSWIKDRFQEKKVLLDECVDHVLRLCQLDESILSPKTENKSTEIPVINIVFHIGQKLSSAMKRRYESQVYNSILSTIKRLSAKVQVEVIVVNLEADIIKMLAAYIDLSSEDQDWSVILKSNNDSSVSGSSVLLSIRFPKQKKIIYHIYEHIQDMKTNISMSTVVLYSIADNMFKVVL